MLLWVACLILAVRKKFLEPCVSKWVSEINISSQKEITGQKYFLSSLSRTSVTWGLFLLGDWLSPFGHCSNSAFRWATLPQYILLHQRLGHTTGQQKPSVLWVLSHAWGSSSLQIEVSNTSLPRWRPCDNRMKQVGILIGWVSVVARTKHSTCYSC